MRLAIKGLSEIRARLEQVRPAEIMTAALAEQAERMAQAVRDSLSEPQGSGEHDKPWARTGALRDSIAVSTEALQAAIGSNDPAAAPQETGTIHIPPRPFLAPVAASMGEAVAKAIGDRLASALRGDLATPASDAEPADSGLTGSDTPATPTVYPAAAAKAQASPTAPAPLVTADKSSTDPAIIPASQSGPVQGPDTYRDKTPSREPAAPE